MRESKDMAREKSLDEVAGAHIHSAKECAGLPLPFVDLNGRNLGSLSHQMFCTRRSKADIARIADERRELEVDPYFESVRQSASKVIRNGVDLRSFMRANEHDMARMIKRYKASLETTSDMMRLQGGSHNHESTHISESEDEGIPDMSRNMIE